ncbi:hypothetical protein F5Y18DRAFT_427672 [Xylariaceae sp. FL1019]|nr:hypothetical protein F5Y18DRAFT_427672 [Xylariaceae sp. FL1019]
MEANGKRKLDASEGSQGSSRKKSKGGNQGKWKTPSHQAKLDATKGRSLEVGDVGIWVTCQRLKEMRAVDEMAALCEEYVHTLFGVSTDASNDQETEDTEDIEASIEKELATLKPSNKPKNAPFEILKMNLDCLLFVRTHAPVDPLALAREIVKDAAATTDKSQWRSRFINKLTPVTHTGKATETGLEEVAQKLLPDHFQLAESETEEANDEEEKICSYAIRPSFRAHTTLKRDVVIENIAKMISKRRHKVDLTNPDKVIIIDIFQTFCGMSVVGKDWEATKRYNIHEMYIAGLKSKPKADTDGSKAGTDVPEGNDRTETHQSST